MKITSIYDILVESITRFSKTPKYPSNILTTLFRENKWLGSKDRHALRELFYMYLRYHFAIITLADEVDQDLIVLDFESECVSTTTQKGRASWSAAFTIAILQRFEKHPANCVSWATSPILYIDPRFEKYRERYLAVNVGSVPERSEGDGNSPDVRDSTKSIANAGSKDSEFDCLMGYASKGLASFSLAEFEKLLVGSLPDLWKEALTSVDYKPINLFTRATTDIRPNYLNLPKDAAVEVITESLKAEFGGIEFLTPQLLADSIKIAGDIKLENFDMYAAGSVDVMDEGSRMLVRCLDPRPNETILDACAGAGGKSLEIQSVTGNLSEVYAFDVVEEKLEELQRRALIAGASVDLWDGQLSDQLSEGFDKVLIDAPCTGSGRIRRQPELSQLIDHSLVEEMAKLQLSILLDYSGLVKVGGELLYATCSVFSAENSEVISEFLEANKNFELIPLAAESIGVDSELSVTDTNGCMQLYPGGMGSDGFFAAKLKRNE